jgi:hypothetical protein
MSFQTFWYAGCERCDPSKPSLDTCEFERHVEVGGLDDPEVGEVLLVSGVDGSWPYGWNRSVV